MARDAQDNGFIAIPRVFERNSELDPYQFRLWVHIKGVGNCWQSIRTLAAVCNMSVGKTSETRKWLSKHGYLRREVDVKTGRMGFVACSPHEQIQPNCSPHEQERSPHEQSVHHMNKGVHQVNRSRSLEVDPLKKKTEEGDFSSKHWAEMLEVLALTTDRATFNLLFLGTELGGRENGTAKLATKTATAAELINHRYADQLRTMASALFEVDLEFQATPAGETPGRGG